MRKSLLTVLCFYVFATWSSAQWQPAGDRLKTEWASTINPENVLSEYPRPIMERENWKNLNGLWDYAIAPEKESFPEAQGKILVPFPIESSLSGVQKVVGPENALWYYHTFTIPADWKNDQILLHFGAVDWKSELWINDIKIGNHQGGYDHFSFNMSPFLKPFGIQKIALKVWDPTNQGPQPVGKQTQNPRGIWYTAVTGIWQTVWLEPVPASHIVRHQITPDIDRNEIMIHLETAGTEFGDIIEARIVEKGKVINSAQSAVGQPITLLMEDYKLWSPESPFLYDLEISIKRKGEILDRVKSYAAMRKISMVRDANNVFRMQLNNKNYFSFGLLDQGWWPDGLYTAPTDEALKYDIEKTKELGFNLIRKHVKVEPDRWYTWCDRLGILVWQDMPNGDRHPEWQRNRYQVGPEMERSPESEAIYRKEWKAIIDQLISHPSIVSWVPFNERWGQFKTQEIAEWTKKYDPSRLVNSASGGNHFPVGDILDVHNYPEPKMDFFDGNMANVLGEYGGIGLALEDHLWIPDRNWGYVQFKTSKDATDEYVKFGEMLIELVRKGFTGAIYTQTTDVEGEVNGMMTYDRKVVKLDADRVRAINRRIVESMK
jgi:beta-galactosidase/beta-glucuronidase